MQLVNEFAVDAPLDVAWSVLTDIPAVIACVPGAELDHRDGDDYHAHVAIKVGPVGMTLSGKASVVSRDDAAKQMVVRGNARDRAGNGSTEATVHMVARGDGGRSVITVTTDLELSGRIAQFGRGVIVQVSNRIIGQFTKRLNAAISGDDATPAPHEDTGSAPAVGPYDAEWIPLLLNGLAGVALGVAVGRWLNRLSPPSPR